MELRLIFPLAAGCFPDFPLESIPALPGAFYDASYDNDACPMFLDERLGLALYIDYPDPAMSAVPDAEDGYERFSVRRMEWCGANGWQMGDVSIIDSDDWSEILAAIAAEGAAGRGLVAITEALAAMAKEAAQMDAYDKMTALYEVWVGQQGLPLVDAEELIHTDLSDSQRQWVSAFIAQWEAEDRGDMGRQVIIDGEPGECTLREFFKANEDGIGAKERLDMLKAFTLGSAYIVGIGGGGTIVELAKPPHAHYRPPALIGTTDLGCDWFANAYDNGSFTLRNTEKGQRIDLPPESVERLRSIFAAAAKMVA